MKKRSVGDGSVRCPDCAKDCRPASIDVGGEPVAGWRCECGYELIHPADIEKAYLFLQARKRERVVISKRGNSYMVTIPKAIAEAMGIESGREAEVFLKDRRTISIVV